MVCKNLKNKLILPLCIEAKTKPEVYRHERGQFTKSVKMTTQPVQMLRRIQYNLGAEKRYMQAVTQHKRQK